MKKINIITSLSPQKQNELYRWFYMTFFLGVSLFSIGIFFISKQLFTYRRLKEDVIAIREKMNNYRVDVDSNILLKKEYHDYRLRENTINSYKVHKKNPYNYIAKIISLCGDGIQLESIRCEKTTIEVVVSSSFADRIQRMIKKLSGSPQFSHIKIISLQQNEQNKEVRCTVKGAIVF